MPGFFLTFFLQFGFENSNVIHFNVIIVKVRCGKAGPGWWVMPLMNQSVYFSLQSTHDHKSLVMVFSLSLTYDGTNKRLRDRLRNNHVEPLLHIEVVRAQDASPGRRFRRVPLARDPRKTLGFLGSVDLETPLNPS